MVSPPDYSDAFNPVDKDTKTLEKCIAARIEGYSDLYDDELWLLFQQEFVLWTEQHLRQAPMPSLFKLRKTLRSNGVYVAKDQRHPAIPLAEARAEAERHQWTESELIQLIQQREQPNSPDLHITYGETIERLRNPTNRAPQQSAHFEQPETPSPPTATLLGPMTRQRSQLLQPQEATLKAPLTQRFYNPTTPGMTTTYEPTVPPTTPGRQDVEVSYTEQNGLSYNANISHLRKAYNEEIKYGGSEDTFDMCYRIFIELCGSTGVHTAEAMRRALWIMLKGDALQFYFDNIEKWTQLRIDPIIAVKNNYENEEHLRHVQEQWDTTTLPYIVRNDITYHAKLISATRLVPACHAATGKPSLTIAGLIEDLRSNRRYHRRQSRSPYRGRSPYQNQQQYGDRRRRSSSWNRSPKTCNVCKKVGCWSTNHTPEEREKALQPYMDRVKAYLTAKEGQPPAATNQDSPDDDEEFKTFLAGVDAPSRYETQDYESKGPSYAVNYFTIANPEHEEYSKSLTNDLANRSAAHFLQSKLRSRANSEPPKDGTNTTSRDITATIDTPQLYDSDQDMDRLGIYFDNTKNVLVGPKPGMTTPISRRFGHPFLIWDHSLKSYLTESFDTDTCFLTETELRRLHRRFGHPSVEKLRKLLVRAGHDVDTEALKHIGKFCHHCQIYGQSPGRFRFTVRDDVSFNHSIIVDIMYINGKPVLHVVDEATRFNAARWLENISAKATWTALRIMWIDMYLGPPDFIVTDAGKNFTSKEFSRDASSMDIIVTTVPVEAHWSIGAVERYHAVLRGSYEIMKEELPDISAEAALQMAVKAVNDTAGPDGLVPTLLVFGAYPRMTEYDPPAPTITQRAAAVKKAMTEIRRLRAQRQVTDAVNTRNGPSSTAVHRLPLNSDILVWREGNTGYAGKWTGPYKLLVMSNETCIIELPNGPTPFRSTAVKPYYTEIDKTKDEASPDKTTTEDRTPDEENEPIPHETIPPPPAVVIPQYEPEASSLQRPQRDRRLPTRYREDYMQHTFLGEFTKEHEDESRHQFAATVLARFEGSQQKEINGLLERGVFEYAQEKDIPPGTRIFTARFVNEVKNNGTDKAFEKSRLVVQAYNDKGKEYVLTQSPTIQRAS
ncbi:hypothetical protein TMatcc_002248 [Talaromyces marneffei ATCC 18224]